jgi:hypothetical protein
MIVGLIGGGGKLVSEAGYDVATHFGATEETAKENGLVAGRVAQVALAAGVADGLSDAGGGEFLGEGSFDGGEMLASNEAIPELTGEGYGPPDETYGLPSEVDGDPRTAHYVEGYLRDDGTYVEGHWKSTKG